MKNTVRSFLEEITHSTNEVKVTTNEFFSYMSVVLLLITNFVAVFLLVPLFIFLKEIELYFVVVLFSILLGVLFNGLLHTLHHLKEHHHLIIAILIPAMALLDMIIVIRALYKIDAAFTLNIQHNPLLIVLTFIIIFLIPYAIDLIRGEHSVKF